MTREEVLRKIETYKDVIKKFGAKKIGVFGSAARDELGSSSDIDIIVEFEDGKKTFKNFIKLAFFSRGNFAKKS